MKLAKKKLLILLSLLIFIISLAILIKNTKKNIDTKSNQIEFLEESLKNKKSQIKNVHEKLLSKNINIEDVVFKDGIKFNQSNKKVIKLNTKDFNLLEFKSNDIIFAKHPEASSSAYLEKYQNNLFLMTATGQLVFTDKNNLTNDNFLMNSIKTNIKNIIKYPEFYSDSGFGIKDILIYKNKIYLSYIKELKKDCYNTSILEGDINFEYISFEEFYSSKDCINFNSKFYENNEHDHFVAHQAGGRMIGIDNNLIFSVGEFRYRILAQDIKKDFGKILSINLLTKEKKIISIGHRNTQGLYFNEYNNTLFSTEHGPSGGDEINILNFDINSNKNEKIPNYGWPIASYGKHYFEIKNDNRLKLSPLKKSHSKNGFIEPIKYFNPSVGISQIIGLPSDFNDIKENQYVVGTMGTAKKLKEGMLSLFYFIFDEKKNKIVKSELIPIKSRIRDLLYLKEEKKLIMFLETNSSLGIINLKN